MAANALLRGLNRIAWAEEGTFTVTLSIPGAIVTGTLISAHEYIRRMAKAVAEGTGDLRGEMAAGFLKANEVIGEPGQYEPTIAYLGDALVFLGDQEAPVGLWACDLDDVTGFTLGRITPPRR